MNRYRSTHTKCIYIYMHKLCTQKYVSTCQNIWRHLSVFPCQKVCQDADEQHFVHGGDQSKFNGI